MRFGFRKTVENSWRLLEEPFAVLRMWSKTCMYNMSILEDGSHESNLAALLQRVFLIDAHCVHPKIADVLTVTHLQQGVPAVVADARWFAIDENDFSLRGIAPSVGDGFVRRCVCDGKGG